MSLDQSLHLKTFGQTSFGFTRQLHEQTNRLHMTNLRHIIITYMGCVSLYFTLIGLLAGGRASNVSTLTIASIVTCLLLFPYFQVALFSCPVLPSVTLSENKWKVSAQFSLFQLPCCNFLSSVIGTKVQTFQINAFTLDTNWTMVQLDPDWDHLTKLKSLKSLDQTTMWNDLKLILMYWLTC